MDIKSRKAVVRDFRLSVEKDDVLRRIKMRPSSLKKATELERILNESMKRGAGLIDAAAVYDTMEIGGVSVGEVRFKKRTFFVRSEKVSALLARCELAVLMAVTVGKGITVETERLMARRLMTEALVLDAYGSEAVEAAADELCGALGKSDLFDGMKMTMRFSPGYGDWDLKEQRYVIEALGAGGIGISVNESSVLIPEKSVTAIAGLHKSDLSYTQRHK